MIYKQSSGILTGASPAPGLANDFVFMRNLNFLMIIINRYMFDTKNNNEHIYHLKCIEQYGSNTKSFIDDILTVAPGLRKRPFLSKLLSGKEGKGGMYGGTYPEHILDDEGEQVAHPVSITEEQRVQTVHFLNVEILQSTPGVSQIRVYDKRDHIETLKQYRGYPHIENRLSKKCLHETLHRQFCRFAIRCSEIRFF